MKAKLVPFLLVLFALSASSAVLNITPAHADGFVVIECPPIVIPLGTPVPRPLPPIVIEPTVLPPDILPCVFPGPCPTPPRPPRPPLPPRPVPLCPAYLSVKNHNVTVTIENQVARTHVDETFINDSAYQLEGTYIFPLPDDAAISNFAMWVDGKKLDGQVLDRNQARQIYEDIVRRQRDPALLEYIGRNAFQARIFPIPPQTEKRVEMEYSQILKVEQGLVRYVYPLNTEKFSVKPLSNVSINISIRSNAALKAIYSPSHQISVARDGDYRARVGYEDSNVKPDRDFVLYYSVTQDDIGLNLLSYKPGSEDGFFLLLVAPKVDVSTTRVIAKDVVLVLDVSGSMQGQKIDQAKRALTYVLDQLNSGDRFNIIAFSTGTSAYASALQPASVRSDAKGFVDRLRAEGSTDINRALLEAIGYADRERPTIIIFLTDGLPTTGETNSQKIIANATNVASKNVRLFTFGVGDDVNTILLDSLAEKLRGASGYVRPNEKIDEIVSAFYSKVSTPVLSDITIDWSSDPAFFGGGIAVSDVYPYPLPDLFAGTQLVVAGRYRNGGATTIALKGSVNGAPQSFKYSDVTFRNSGGDDFIPRLWATRKIGYLLNQIRLNGETKEVVNEIVTLAVRYGIVTPYTSFLIDERKDVFTPQGRTGAAQELQKSFAPSLMPDTGAAAVQQSQLQNQLRRAETAPTTSAGQIKSVGDKTFILRNDVWTDTQFDPSKMMTTKIEFGSDAYFALLDPKGLRDPSGLVGKYLALGSRVIVVLNGAAYEIVDNGGGSTQTSPPAPPPSGEGSRGGVGGEVIPTAESRLLPISIQTPIATLSRAQDNASQAALLIGVVLVGIGMVVSAGVVTFLVLKRKR